jgi:hypothetical protein
MMKHPGYTGWMKLGDRVHSALSAVGITEERVSAWVGENCGCKERRERLNRLSDWAERVLMGRSPEPARELDQIVSPKGPK